MATPKSVKGIIRLQAIVRGRAARALFLKRRRGLAYRDRVAQEILSTEQSYVSGLQVLVRVYIEPLEAAIKDGKPILSKEEVKTIFGNIQVILGVNAVLLKDIEARLKTWGPQQCLGDIFLNICKFLKVYTQFIRDYGQIMTTIAGSLKQNKRFDQFCKTAERETKGYPLDSYLILPVQRIPRYILLLNELKKHTWEDHKDYKNIVDAWTQVQEVAHYVNQKKKESEDLSRVLEIESKIEGVLKHELVEAHRKFVRQVEVKAVKDKKKRVDRTLLIFNDLVLVTKSSGDKFKLVDEINLDPKKINAVVTKDNADDTISLANDMDVVLLTFTTDPVEKRIEVRDELNRLRSEFDERTRASDAHATKRAQQKVEDFKHLVEASVESDASTSSEQLTMISKGGSMKMRPRRQHPENVQKLKDELKKIEPDMIKELLTEERSFVKTIALTLQEGKKKASPRALFLCDDIVLLLKPHKDQAKHPDEYKYIETYQVMSLTTKECTGPTDGSYAELHRGEGIEPVGPFRFNDEAERKTFMKEISSLHSALKKRNKQDDDAKNKKAQKKAESVKKSLAESYGKSKGDKAAKQVQDMQDSEEVSDASAVSSGGENGGGLRKWAQKKEEIKKATAAREASKK